MRADMSKSGFFDDYSEFYRTTKTLPSPNRLNARYRALIEENRSLLEGQSVLDLASHDGRWSFAALKNGAKYVCGVEGRHDLVASSVDNMKKYEIPESSYSFIQGDAIAETSKMAPSSFDVVFCFGFFYHTLKHWNLLLEIKRLNPKYLILDTGISTDSRTIIEIKKEDSSDPRNAMRESVDVDETTLIGMVSRSALELMLENLRFDYEYYDWRNRGISDWRDLRGYKKKQRISLRAKNLDRDS